MRSLALALVLLVPAAARADLDEYLAKPEPKYRWEKKGEDTVSGCKVYDLFLVSQEWQGKPWEHRLVVIRPEKIDHPGFCSIYNTGGRGGKEDIELGAQVATKSRCTFAMLFGVPNQPLWDKTEDALVVHTWLQFMESMKKDGKGDESWPLHFPMAKAVIKGMDTVQAFAKESGFTAIEGFMVCGASKRGWTTWLVGASKDQRVKAIAPMVIDILNVAKQAEHQLASWGKPSEQVRDYTTAGMLNLFSTPEGKRLLELEDPYSYRDRITMPKLIVNGTNDRYWTQDALNLYWDGLVGPKSVLYVPNSGHKLEDRGRVIATMAAFVRAVAGGVEWPKLSWKYEPKAGGGFTLSLESNTPLDEARLFTASSSTKDFRSSKWSYAIMTGEKGSWSAGIDPPSEGALAVFAEAAYNMDGTKFTLSTQIRILTPPPPQKKRWF